MSQKAIPPQTKKNYQPPAIREEEVFERAAMQGGTTKEGSCKSPVPS